MVATSDHSVFLLLLVTATCGFTRALVKTGVQNLCASGQRVIYGRDTWTTDSSGILVPKTYGVGYQTGMDCVVVIKPLTPRQGVVVSVREIDLRPNRMDSLTITYNEFYDQKQTFVNVYSTIDDRMTDYLELKSYYSQENITIRFTTERGGYSTSEYHGFQLTYTIVSSRPCGSYEFGCASTGRCIARDLQCDGHNHCGDRSDQFFCDEDLSSVPVGGIIGGILGTVFLVIVLSCALVTICRSMRKRRRPATRTLNRPAHSGYPQQLHTPVEYADPPPTYFETFPERENGIVNPAYR